MPNLKPFALMISLFVLGSAYTTDKGSNPKSEISDQTEITLPSMQKEKYKLNDDLTVSVFPIPTATFVYLSSSKNSRVNIQVESEKGEVQILENIDLPYELNLIEQKRGKIKVNIQNEQFESSFLIKKII